MTHEVPADVSAIIPVRNGAAFIAAAISSVRGQTARPRETIVVDDGSTDATAAIVRSHPEVTYLFQEAAGAAEARNAGVRRSTMPFLAFLDADDLWTPDKTRAQLDLLASHPDLDVAAGQLQQFADAGGHRELLGEPSLSHLLPVLLLRRSVFERVGELSSTWAVGETIEWWARALDLGVACGAVPSVVYLRRRHATNSGRTTQRPAAEYLRMLRGVVERRRRDRGDESR